MSFIYNGTEELTYSDVDGAPLVAIPGQTYNISAAPDDQWSATQTAPESTLTPPEAPTTASDPTPTPTN